MYPVELRLGGIEDQGSIGGQLKGNWIDLI